MCVILPFPSNSSSCTCIGVGLRVVMSFSSASSTMIEQMQTDIGKKKEIKIDLLHIRIYEISYNKI